MSVDYLVNDLGFEVAQAADRDSSTDSFVTRRNPKGADSAAGDAGDTDLLGINLRTADEVINGSYGVPTFDPG